MKPRWFCSLNSGFSSNPFTTSNLKLPMLFAEASSHIFLYLLSFFSWFNDLATGLFPSYEAHLFWFTVFINSYFLPWNSNFNYHFFKDFGSITNFLKEEKVEILLFAILLRLLFVLKIAFGVQRIEFVFSVKNLLLSFQVFSWKISYLNL